MYDYKSHASYVGLPSSFTAALEKHQEMVRNAMRQQQMSRLVGEARNPVASTLRRRLAFATLLNLFTR